MVEIFCDPGGIAAIKLADVVAITLSVRAKSKTMLRAQSVDALIGAWKDDQYAVSGNSCQ